MSAAAQPSTGVSRETVVELADNFVALVRSFNRTRARMLAAATDDVEWSSQVLLKFLDSEGPMRSSALAEHVQADPSTVSRQVATLVREGLVERRADPEDGRASLLVLTPKAGAVLERHAESRLEFFAALIADWDGEDVVRFTEMLGRFTESYDSANSAWITERIARRSASAGSND